MTVFYVKVRPGSDSFEIENGSMVKVSLTSEAENGRANSELVKRLENVIGEEPGIISGQKSRRKKLKVRMAEKKLESKLESWEDG